MLLLLACFFDYRRNRIPNWLIAAGVVGFFVLYFYNLFSIYKHNRQLFFSVFHLSSSEQLQRIILFSVAAGAVLYLFFKIGMLGAGDVKLYMVSALYLKQNRFLWFVLFSMLIALFLGVIQMIRKKNGRESISYFCSYLGDLIRSGKISLYITNDNDAKNRSAQVHMAGPMLAGAVFCLLISM